ncbi:hypothetical protein JCM11251_007738 [Rhodosporidiobolus azoricus]
MGYLNDGDGVSLVFLPARAANVSVCFASLASFCALAMLARAGLVLDLSEGKSVLVIFLAVIFLCWASTGLVLAYARWLPPPDSRLWQFIASTTSYLSALWIICFALTVALSMELLFPLITWFVFSSFRFHNVLLIALLLNLVLAVFVTFDLRNSRHSANVLILRAQMTQQHRRQAHFAAQRRQQAGWPATTPLMLESAMSSEEEQARRPQTKQETAQQKNWVINAFLARAKEPAAALSPTTGHAVVPDWYKHPLQAAQAFPSTPVSTLPPHPPFPLPPHPMDALGVPALFSMEKRHSHSSRHGERRRSHHRPSVDDEADEDEDEGRSRSRSRGKRGRGRDRHRRDDTDDTHRTEGEGIEQDTDDERGEELRRQIQKAKAAGAAEEARAERHQERHRRLQELSEEEQRLEDEEEEENEEKENSEKQGRRAVSGRKNGVARKMEEEGGETPTEADTRDEEREQHPSTASKRRSKSRKRDARDAEDRSGDETPSTAHSLDHTSHRHRSRSGNSNKRRSSHSHSRPHRSSSSAPHHRHHSRSGHGDLSSREKEKLLAEANLQNVQGTTRETASAVDVGSMV